jgi:hypothetical protein
LPVAVSLHQEYGLAGTHRYGCCSRAEDDDSDDEAEGQSQQNLAETSSHPIYTGEASPVEDRLPETNGENSAAISSSDSDEDEDSNQDEDEDDQ